MDTLESTDSGVPVVDTEDDSAAGPALTEPEPESDTINLGFEALAQGMLVTGTATAISQGMAGINNGAEMAYVDVQVVPLLWYAHHGREEHDEAPVRTIRLFLVPQGAGMLVASLAGMRESMHGLAAYLWDKGHRETTITGADFVECGELFAHLNGGVSTTAVCDLRTDHPGLCAVELRPGVYAMAGKEPRDFTGATTVLPHPAEPAE